MPPSKEKPGHPLTAIVDELDAVLKWTSDDKTLDHLQHVAFRDDEYVATDGHRLVCVPCPTFGQQFALHRDHLRAAIAAFRVQRTSRYITLAPSPETMHITVPIGPEIKPDLMRVTIPMRGIDECHTTAVISKVTKGSNQQGPLDRHWFDPKYLSGIWDVMAADTDGQNARGPDAKVGLEIVAWSDDRRGPAVFRSGKGVRFVIMPVWNGVFETVRRPK